MGQAFEVGQIVSLRADETRRGPVTQLLTPVNGVRRYRVYHGPTDSRDYLEDQLLLVRQEPDTPTGLDEGTLDLEQFRVELTAKRLSLPETDALYAFRAARIKFIPFQFKPLLRML